LKRILTVLVLVTLAGCTAAGNAHDDSGTAESAAPATIRITPEMRVSRLFEARCMRCHGGDSPAAGLDLSPERFAEAMAGVESRQVDGVKHVDLEAPEKSYLLMKLRGAKGIEGRRMPSGSAAFSDEDIGLVEEWIRELAEAAAAAAEEPAKDSAGESPVPEGEGSSSQDDAAGKNSAGADDAADESGDDSGVHPGEERPRTGE
jgi:cytochrome c553